MKSKNRYKKVSIGLCSWYFTKNKYPNKEYWEARHEIQG